MLFRNLIRNMLGFLHLDVTRNMKYDRLTRQIIKNVVNENSNCVDVGCHTGSVLDFILQFGKHGKHFAFEPVPPVYRGLKMKYGHVAEVLPYAISDVAGTATFNYVKNSVAYSGLKQRKYNVSHPDIEKIKVETCLIDDVIPPQLHVDFIKIDMEGGEFGVLKGARKLLLRCKPVVVFECGLGASDFYGTQPEELYHFITGEVHLKLSLPGSFINGGTTLSLEQFAEIYHQNSEYYFVAHP